MGLHVVCGESMSRQIDLFIHWKWPVKNRDNLQPDMLSLFIRNVIIFVKKNPEN